MYLYFAQRTGQLQLLNVPDWLLCRNMSTAYNMEFPESGMERRKLRGAWMRHNILSWLEEKGDLNGI